MDHRLRPVLLIVFLATAALACNAVDLPQAVQPSAGAPPVAEPSTTPAPSATSVPATMAVFTPELSPTVPIVHTMFPGDPPLAARFMTDRSSAALAGERRSIADDFNVGLFERPFTSQAMDYKAYLDLTRGEIAAAGVWMYVTLQLEALPSPADAAFYGVELDLDRDGRGDWLVVAAAPPDTNWTTNGVRVFQDTDNDIGAQTPVRSDPPGQTDGYDSLVFDSGIGADPDAAWTRRSLTSSTRIEIAFKAGLIAGDDDLFWWVWSFADPQPPWQDYQDHFTLAQAGSPLSENSQYPLKDLALIDSSCRWGFDFNPTVNEPGVCPLPPTPTPLPTATKTPTATQYIIF